MFSTQNFQVSTCHSEILDKNGQHFPLFSERKFQDSNCVLKKPGKFCFLYHLGKKTKVDLSEEFLGKKGSIFPCFQSKIDLSSKSLGIKTGSISPVFNKTSKNCLQKTLGNLGSISPVFIKTFPKIDLSEKILGQILAEDHPGDKTHIQKIDLSEKLLRKNGQQLPVFIQSCFCLDLMLKMFMDFWGRVWGEEFWGRALRNLGGRILGIWG